MGTPEVMSYSDLDDAVFPQDRADLPTTRASEIVDLADGETLVLRITPVCHRIGDHEVRMLAYNGSIPGPTLRVRRESTVHVDVHNDADGEATVHWHGLRVENRFDGVAGATQAAIPVGGRFTYELRFPDDGLYWYHPHIREDYGLEMGLYGNIIVEPIDRTVWGDADRSAVVTLDDVFIEDGQIGSFRVAGPTHTAMGRYGNTMLTAGTTELRLTASAGEVLRLFLTNTANTRIFNFAVPDAQMKLVAGDSGCYEQQRLVDSVLLAPSERAVVDVFLPRAGRIAIAHMTPDQCYLLGSIEAASASEPPTNPPESFRTLRRNDDLGEERARLNGELDRDPDKTLVLRADMPILHTEVPGAAAAALWTCPMHPEYQATEPGACPHCGMPLIPVETSWTCPMHAYVVADSPGTCPRCGMALVPRAPTDATTGHAHPSHEPDGLEWEDLMPDLNARTDDQNMIWQIVDADTGTVNTQIDWSFRVGDRVKIRLVNTMDDNDHPMHHPFHVHGAGRFLILARDGNPEPNLVWKDTVLVRAGETVDLLLDVTSPGVWMAHCHIAEHHQDGMMFTFRVDP